VGAIAARVKLPTNCAQAPPHRTTPTTDGRAKRKKNARPVRAGREDSRSRALQESFWREEFQYR